jgi:hypothetical protein
MGLKADNKQLEQEMISERKLITSISVLCDGLPSEFAIFLTQVRRLEFADKPNYESFRALFRGIFLQQGFVYDYQYDWLTVECPSAKPLVLRKFPPNEGKQTPSLPAPTIVKPKRNNPSAPILPTALQKVTIKRQQIPHGERPRGPPRLPKLAGPPTFKPLSRPYRV